MSNEINLREALTVARWSLLVPRDAGCSLLARHAAGWVSDDTAVLVLRSSAYRPLNQRAARKLRLAAVSTTGVEASGRRGR